MKKIYYPLLLMCLSFLSLSILMPHASAQTTTFTFNGTTGLGASGINGTPQTYVVPAGVTQIGVDMYGGAGGWPCCSWTGTTGGTRALGGRVQCTMNVTPGTTLYVYVGGAGCNNLNSGTQSPGGWNGGGIGGAVGSSFCAGGGGATDIRTSTTGYSSANVLVVAGAGGGGGDFGPVGGAGGGTTGATGQAYSCLCTTGGACGGGQTGPSCATGSGLGTQGQGGSCVCYSEGGGGGGWWGGNGGTAGDGAGAGGSSYPAAPNSVVTAIVHTQGYSGANGNGQCIITVLCSAPGAVVGAGSICPGATLPLTNPTGASGGTWTSSNTAVGTIDPVGGVFTGLTPGTTTITYVLGSPCGGTNASATVTVLPVPGTITGSANICLGGTTNLTDGGTGTWTSSNPAVAAVGTSGTVSGITTGTAVISYTLSTGCAPAVKTVTVNPNPSSITGTSVICGSLSTTLICSPAGGTWSSTAPTVATVGSVSGLVTGLAAGTTVISYLLPTGCSSVFPMSVNPLSAITGVPSMCLGYGTSLADATPGGTWSSTNPSIATVSVSGAVSSVALGSAIISYYVPSSGCAATVAVTVTPPPSVFTMTGGGSTCPGGTVTVGLSGSNSGIIYTLYNGSLPVLPTVTGFGSGFSFPPVSSAGSYTVVAGTGACASVMSGTATVSINPLPTQYVVSASGGGAFCSGSTGVHIFLSSSQIGVNYQLFNGTLPVGAPIPGTSAALDFGLVTAGGTYTVAAYNVTTTCVNNMANSVTVTVNPLPSAFAVSPGIGGYCTGGSGTAVSLVNSTSGISYQLYIGGVATGSAVLGTGSSISFGLQTIPGTYTVIATNPATGCSTTMTGSSVISINPLPTVFGVTGGGSICSSGPGADVQLNGSQSGVNYQLYRGGVAVAPAVILPGTGGALDFGLQTVAGAYTVVASNPTTTCTSNMSYSANVFINPLPTAFAVTASALSYCAGGTGVHILLSGSVTGTVYNLYNGATLVGSLSGTGSALDFGLVTSAGTYSVTAVVTATGCSAGMNGNPTISINALPAAYTVTVAGGGVYCAGGAGQVIGLSGSQSGVSYQLFRAGVAVGTSVAGTGSAISFPAQTAAGAYTVVATNTTTLCTSNMSGSAAIIINPAPVVYNVTGGGPYCAGGTGVLVGLSGSDIGISYQLMNGTPSGAPLSGIGGTLNFGLQTTAGTYTIVATNSTTGCSSNMSGSAPITVNPLPAINILTTAGSGSYCAGGTGVVLGLNGSVSGVNYQLYNGTALSGTAVSGTGSAISFGSVTAAGTYTAKAINAVTGCTSNMTGSSVINVLPAPGQFNVAGGGSYCAGSAGLHVTLAGSQTGKKYQLYNPSGPVGALVTGTGFALDFGAQTVAGTYTVVATDTVTGCTGNMTGSVSISVNALPAAFVVGGGGSYCAGSAGPHISLSNTAVGINYQLMAGTSPAGALVPGTGSPVDFGAQSGAGTYTVVGINSTTGCTANMTGSAVVVMNALPAAFAVTGGGNYCPGGAGVHIGLAGSLSGTIYQLYRGSLPVGAAITGTGAALDFGLQTVTGTYTVVATNVATTCTGAMTGSVTIGISTLPVVYNVTGTANYCPGGAGAHVGLSGSAAGVTYQLFRGGTAVGSPFTGTGSALDFGLQTTGIYTVVATSTSTTCTNNMNGTAVIGISALPAAHTVTGGGNFCTGGTGVHVGLNGSDPGIWYQLFQGTSPVGTAQAGTGSSLDFGLQTGTGIYTVLANSTTTTCQSGMSGSVTVGINPLPAAFSVSGGGHYCAGGTGADITMSGSATGVNYQLYHGSFMVGSAVAGTGTAIDFGPQTAAGTYTVLAADAATLCTSAMTGGATVVVNPLPSAYSVSGGGNYCAGTSGVHVALTGSEIGTTYQLFNGGVAASGSVAGTGFGLDFGTQTATGTYTVVASNTSTTCSGNMTGSVTVGINPAPTAYLVSGSASTYCAGGPGIDINLSGSDLGTSYQLYNGPLPVGGTVAGTSASIDFGYHTASGSYTVMAVNNVTGCSGSMAGAASVSIGALPVAFSVTGGGSFCAGGTGVHIGLSGSNSGVLYQLFRGTTMVGSPVAGGGGSIDFGLQANSGTYTVVGTNPASTCTNSMAGTAVVSVSALPAPFNVTGGGHFCASDNGVHVGLSGSTTGISYQLYKSGSVSGAPVNGTGGPIDFGLRTLSGVYTVIATNAATTCSGNMTGSATVTPDALPVAQTVTGGGSYCPGGAGVHVGLASSASGVSYQLFRGTSVVGAPVNGTGGSVDFGLQTAAGTYTVVGLSGTTTCTNNMAGTATITVNTPPQSFNVVGGGSFCSGSAGVHIGISGSAAGISYQAYYAYSPAGSPVIGTGSPLDLGAETVAGMYTVIATDPTTTCTRTMNGNATVTQITTVVPTVTVSTGAGDSLCSGILTNFTAVTTNTGTAPTYQWTVNGVVTGTANHYNYIPVNGDVVGVTVTSNAQCASPAVVNNAVSLNVSPLEAPSVVISSVPGNEVCQGTRVYFSAVPTGGGSAPVYSWIKNGSNVGSTATYNYIPANGDVIYCTMSSNYHCRTANNASSNQINLTVDQPLTPVVTITTSTGGHVGAGQSVTFTAVAGSAGPAPTYQWFVNGVAVPGATFPTYTGSNFNNLDSICCQVTSSGGCSGIVGSGCTLIHVSVGVNPVVLSGSDIRLIPNPNNGVFTLSGSLASANDEEVIVEVTDMLGQVVYHKQLTVRNGDLNEKIALSNAANGMYLLSLRSGSDARVFHMVVEK